jgi:amino acid transporter
VVITSAWSSSNQALLAGTRVLYSLALKKQAPAIFLRTTAWGVPYVCVLVQTLFMFLAFMSLSSSALTVRMREYRYHEPNRTRWCFETLGLTCCFA